MEKLLQEMDLLQGKVWPYDPKGVLSNRKRKIKSTAYVHETRPFIEWRANLDTWPLDAQMEAESSAAEGRGDNLSMETEYQVHVGVSGVSGGQEGMDIDEGTHPHKKQRTAGIDVIGKGPCFEYFPQFGAPDKNKGGFMITFNDASSSGLSRLSKAITVNRLELREEINTRNKSTRDK